MGSEITIILGNVGRDPETRFTQEGKQVTTFSVAVSRGQKTNWYRVTCWERLAEVTAKYVTKGMWLQVTGSVQADAYIGKDGKPRASLELTARSVEFGPKLSDDDDTMSDFDDPTEGDIPF